MQDIELTGSQEVLDELQSGRTRELLMLLQDKPVPEVVDPLNVQSALSQGYELVGSDYQLSNLSTSLVDDFEDQTADLQNSSYDSWTGDTGSIGTTNSPSISGSYSFYLEAPTTTKEVTSSTSSDPPVFEFDVLLDEQSSDSNDSVEISFGNDLLIAFSDSGDINVSGSTLRSWSANTTYSFRVEYNSDFSSATIFIDGVDEGSTPVTGSMSEINVFNNTFDNGPTRRVILDNIYEENPAEKNGFITDSFSAPTTAPADFKQWNVVRAEDVTVGGSTSANPVEFEILDSSDTVLTSARIPKSELADEPFTMRDRVYSGTAGSDGQSDYQIATTGDGGHFGIPILTVVSVKKNGSVLDSANWSFDPDTETVTIDTSNVSIASGDTIDIKYDFDVFDSTLQPRAYLSRESTSETSPSISHFRYEYVI